jgi:hypothetical protein
MEYRTVVVPADDIGLLQSAIALGDGTITHSRKCDDGNLAVTYVGAPRFSEAAGPGRAAVPRVTCRTTSAPHA